MPDSGDTRHISSLVVQVRPEALASARQAIAVLPGAEIHGADASGKLVVVLDTADEAEILNAIAHIHDMPGVITASLIYHEIDSLAVEEN
jgi:nitrate reductase NapD